MALTNAQILKIVELFNKYSDSNVPVEVLDNLKELVNDAYSAFNDRQIKMSTMGADDTYSNRRVCFVKVIWKVLMEWLWNPTFVPVLSNRYGALYNWYAITHTNVDPLDQVKYGMLYNWYAASKTNNKDTYGGLYNWYAATHKHNTDVIKYGYLYNWYAATDVRNIANTGWHIPSDSEIETLAIFIDPTAIPETNNVGGHLKEIGGTRWNIPNIDATNTYGFNFTGGAIRGGGNGGSNDGIFNQLKYVGYFWSSSFDSLYGHVAIVYNSSALMNYYTTYGPHRLKGVGISVRPIKDSTILTDGQTGTYTGNDGRVYNTICIGTQEWLSENLVETKYRNGDAIPVETNDAVWAALITGARCSYDNDEANAFEFVEDLAPTGWHVPTFDEYSTLITFLIDEYVAGGKLKETGILHWESPNTGATNEVGFNLLGNGERDSLGVFLDLKKTTLLWTATSFDVDNARFFRALYNSATLTGLYEVASKKYGGSIRCLYDGVDPLDPGTVTDIDGNIYKTVKIGTQVWMAENLKVEHYNDGSDITIVTDNATWAALVTEAMCYYNNERYQLAPIGWHVPTKTEFYDLAISVGGYAVGGNNIKESGNLYWENPTPATNLYGFNGRGAGIRRYSTGVFAELKTLIQLWSSTNDGFTYTLNLTDTNAGIGVGGVADVAFKRHGSSVRLIKDSTALSIGETGTMTDYDGNVYPTVCMPDGNEWMAANLMVTRYNDGTPIPEVTDNTAWSLLIDGARCYYNNNISYSLNYNLAPITPAGWHVPNYDELVVLGDELGGGLIAGGKLKEMGFDTWNTPNTGASNITGFNGKGAGIRNNTGDFVGLKISLFMATSEKGENELIGGYNVPLGFTIGRTLVFNTAAMGVFVLENMYGFSIRFIKDDSTDPGSITDVDGNVYPTVKIGDQVWMAENLRVTHYNDGTSINFITDPTAWINDTEGAMCWYNNNKLQQ